MEGMDDLPIGLIRIEVDDVGFVMIDPDDGVIMGGQFNPPRLWLRKAGFARRASERFDPAL